jgi:RNA-directed DNA polymerase
VRNTDSETRPGRGAGPGVSSGLDRVREVAVREKDARFTALLHHITLERLWKVFTELKRDAAPGADGLTWWQYEQDLRANLEDLHGRVQSGKYRAKPVRRVLIPKPDGRMRPLGVASLEDKIVQRAVVEVLNAVFEADFPGFSYGFRPGRGPHRALDALTAGIQGTKVSWVLDADIRDFFGSLDRSWLEKFLRHRIADERVLRLIGKWMAAGVIEDGKLSEMEQGTPQGAPVSPLLANVYLHHVLDLWAVWWRNHEARGDVIIARFADDFVAGFQYQDDAERFLAALRERFAKFSLELHPGKTRLIEFGRFAIPRRKARGAGKPETFSFLGFTHICAINKRGQFWVRRITDRKRLTAKLAKLKAGLLRRRHDPVPDQGIWLASVINGHMNYYAVPGNGKAVRAFREQAVRYWYTSLRRRSQKTRLTWERMGRLARRWIPRPVTKHPFPEQRFAARYS